MEILKSMKAMATKAIGTARNGSGCPKRAGASGSQRNLRIRHGQAQQRQILEQNSRDHAATREFEKRPKLKGASAPNSTSSLSFSKEKIGAVYQHCAAAALLGIGRPVNVRAR